jgi:glycosyltransferase involved in cell wall biosynthesis
LESISSIISQTHTNIEIIVLDDGSTDKSIENAQSFHDKTIKICSETANKGIEYQFNKGVSKGIVYQFNKGISMAKGGFIARMDSDNISLPQRLVKQLHYLKENQM